MPFYQTDSIRYFSFDSLTEAGVTNAAFTRFGGVSPEPWASLNVGGTVGDDFERVLENRRRSFRALGCPFDSLFDVWQVHGTKVVSTHAPHPVGASHVKADVILTDRPGVTLFMRFADCVPIFLYDPVHRVIGLAHAGWLGTIQFVAAHAIKNMRACYGSIPKDILVGIGPSIGPDHYQVGSEVIQRVRQAFGSDADLLLLNISKSGVKSNAQFDLWSANILALKQVGVKFIEASGICTACNTNDWYSHRAEKGRTGRFGALMALRE